MEDRLRLELEKLQHGQDDILRQLTTMNGTLRDVVIELGGVPGPIGRDPNRKTIRVRLHDLENDKSTVRAARVALHAAQQVRDSAAEKRFSRREKLAVLAISILLFLDPFIVALTHTG